MRTLSLTRKQLASLVGEILDMGIDLVGPAMRGAAVEYQPVNRFDDLRLGERPKSSLKAFFLPPTEPLLRWHRVDGETKLQEVSTTFQPRVVLGSLPCDAAAVEIVDKVMNWDYHDELWNGRRAATTIISWACPGGDESCFCTAVGLAPDSQRGSDILLVPNGDELLVEVITEKGEAFVESHATYFGPPTDNQQHKAYRQQAKVKVLPNLQLNSGDIKDWLKSNYEHPFWQRAAQGCHGCGACAFVCPTCHCFDIVDEPEGPDSGTRRRNWDSCQIALFTLHGAGHNPRPDQSSRYRQRIMHKFSIYPERFSDILCTGCGRCVRVCPGGIDLVDTLRELNEMVENSDAAATIVI